MCSILSNSVAIQLTWRVSIPELEPVNITYSTATSDRTNLNSYISTVLTGFGSGEFIHSTLEIIVIPDIPTDQIVVECMDDNQNDSIIVLINATGENQSFFVTFFFHTQWFCSAPSPHWLQYNWRVS